jgi:aspartyl-tRNA(Asn)/glutamyl-tRNA(Gln) amidotransferase subunit B
MMAGTEKEYLLTVGLEVHAELKTQSKMFCGCKNDPDEKEPNVHVCPICMGHPGTLPVINAEAVRHVLRMGAAVGGTLANYTEFDRKNYFYPDIPKGYQISQYQFPLVTGGSIRGVDITRIHLEEDTARSSHDKGDYSLVDFNRAGLPLLELVTEPVIHSAKDAALFAMELQLLLRMLSAGDANMEKGEMRVEANISVSATPGTFGTKVEVKNLNSFRAVERAIEYEYRRQIDLLEKGGKVTQETRGYDEVKGTTFSQRLKESSHDYRYFPDPDLPKLILVELEQLSLDQLKKSLPKLPEELRTQFNTLGIKDDDAEVLISTSVLRTYIEVLLALTSNHEIIRQAVNYLVSDIGGIAKKLGEKVYDNIAPPKLLEVVELIHAGDLSSRGAKDVLMYIADGENGTAREVAVKHTLIQQSDTTAIESLVTAVIAANAKAVGEYKSGKSEALKFLIGQVMKLSKGSANPAVIEKVLKSRLD